MPTKRRRHGPDRQDKNACTPQAQGSFASRSIRFLMTELDPAIGIAITPFDMGGASAFGLAVTASILAVENDSPYPGLSPNKWASATAVVDAANRFI